MMDRLLTTILLVTDCSDGAPLAARVAAELAVKTGATLHLDYTWAPVTLDAYSVPGLTAASVDQDCFEVARGVLTLSVRLLERQGATVSGQYLRIGRAADETSALVATPGADLIVVGSRGSGLSPDPLLGTDADGIVRMATCPVLVVRGHSTSWPPSRIVVGDDGSSDAARTVGFAVSLGRVLNVETMLARPSGAGQWELLHPGARRAGCKYPGVWWSHSGHGHGDLHRSGISVRNRGRRGPAHTPGHRQSRLALQRTAAPGPCRDEDYPDGSGFGVDRATPS